jgi:DNA-binding XRE family transcriptional regulator
LVIKKNAIHGLEVISIMMSLFDQGEVIDIYVANVRSDAKKEKTIEMARKLLKKNQMSKEDIAEVTGLSMKKINKLEKEIM